MCSFVYQLDRYVRFGTNATDGFVPRISVADALSAAPARGRSLGVRIVSRGVSILPASTLVRLSIRHLSPAA